MGKFFAKSSLLILGTVAFCQLQAQLVVNGGTLTINNNAFISVQGNLTSNVDIQGAGKIIMSGTTPQQINTNGFAIPNLEINSAEVDLVGNTKVSGTLNFVAGKVKTGDFNLVLASPAAVTGAGVGKFVETNGTGQVRKEVTVAGSYTLPVGTGTSYMPIQYQLTGGAYAAGAYVATSLVSGAHPKKPIRATDYIGGYWKTAYSGVTGATVNLVGNYNDAGGVTGTENLLYALRYDGTNWSIANNTIDRTTNTVTYNTVSSGSDLFATDKFLLVSPKVFLQAAYNTGTAKMGDALRTLNLIPASDPYRTAPYSTAFTHTANTEVEGINPAVFATQAIDNDNIVDWVFLELRTTANAIVQTRSALVQKDGDVVDIDGINPVMFKDLDASNYILNVRHRNHLGVRSATNLALSPAKTGYDFTNASNKSFQTQAYTSTVQLGTIWALRGGNANMNANVRYSGPGNDQNQILNIKLAGSASTIQTSQYAPEDVNMNGNVRWSGPGNDQNFLLNTILGGSASRIYNQQL